MQDWTYWGDKGSFQVLYCVLLGLLMGAAPTHGYVKCIAALNTLAPFFLKHMTSNHQYWTK